MRSPLLDRVRADAIGAGLNLIGLVDRQRFDASEPKERRIASIAADCGTVVVLGSAGCAPSGQPCGWLSASAGEVPSPHASDRIVEVLRSEGVACRSVRFDGGSRLNSAKLGEAAGFGTVSPVSGLLLHPEFGPWLRVRAAVLCAGSPFGVVGDASISDRFQPCCACERPCLAACPASVHDVAGAHDLAACASHRHEGGCADGCASRAACPVGSAHRDRDGQQTHSHTFELATMQRWFGLGVWRFVPKPLRGGR